jgi:hypothetical protein
MFHFILSRYQVHFGSFDGCRFLLNILTDTPYRKQTTAESKQFSRDQREHRLAQYETSPPSTSSASD